AAPRADWPRLHRTCAIPPEPRQDYGGPWQSQDATGLPGPTERPPLPPGPGEPALSPDSSRRRHDRAALRWPADTPPAHARAGRAPTRRWRDGNGHRPAGALEWRPAQVD